MFKSSDHPINPMAVPILQAVSLCRSFEAVFRQSPDPVMQAAGEVCREWALLYEDIAADLGEKSGAHLHLVSSGGQRRSDGGPRPSLKLVGSSG